MASPEAPTRKADSSCIESIGHIIKSIVAHTKKINGPTRNAQVTLEEAWDALNKWILERMRIQRGAHLPNLGRWTWQLTGPNAARPVFILSKAFYRTNGLPFDRRADPNRLVECSEIDYSTLALRFSRRLTKDMMFWALRDLTRGISASLSRRPTRIEMSVGTLSRDMDGAIAFAFDMTSLQPPHKQHLPLLQPVEEQDNPTLPEVAFEKDSQPTEQFREVKAAPRPCAGLAITQGAQAAEQRREVKAEAGPCAGSANKKRNGVMDLAMARCVADLEALALQNERERTENERAMAEAQVKHRRQIEEQKRRNKEVQVFLKHQIQEAKQRRDEDRKNVMVPDPPLTQTTTVAEALNHPLRAETLPGPLKLHAITGGPTRGRATPVSGAQLKGDLEAQIEAKVTKARITRRQMIEEERSFVAQVNKEMDRARRQEADRTRAMTDSMLTAWKVNAHVKNLCKVAALGPAKLRQYNADNISCQHAVGFDVRDCVHKAAATKQFADNRNLMKLSTCSL